MEREAITLYRFNRAQLSSFVAQIKSKSDKLINYFLFAYFIAGLSLADFYDTWLVALSIGGLCLIAYYSAKLVLKDSDLYQYVLSAIMGIFMAQYIYQMHGLFEMHFIAFIGSAMLITYQNWKLQIPIAVVVIIHHAIFGYLQFSGFTKVYFTQLEYMDLQTFLIHIFLAGVIFCICGLWAYHFKKYSERHIEQNYEMGRLQEAEVQKEALMKSNMELDKFVYSVSHDLRAPLTSMQGVIEITKDECKDSFVLEHLDLLNSSIKKLDSFIGDILDYSRNSKTDLRTENIDFKEMLSDIVNNLKHMSGKDRKVDINVNVNSQGAFLSDKNRLNVVLNNLISNSIRYQNPDTDKPFVNVSVEASKEEAVITVKDNGIGIGQKDHGKIFEMFYRVSENSNGSGLGLYIVKEAINKLHGKIELESDIGAGTIFNIHIPNFNNSKN